MRRKSKTGAKLLLAGALVAGTSLVGVPSAAAATNALDLNYRCDYPLLGLQDIKVHMEVDNIPTEVGVGDTVNNLPIRAKATVPAETTEGLRTINATKLSGLTVADAHVTAPDFDPPIVRPRIGVPSTNIPASGPFDIDITGSTPSFTFPKAGWGRINIGNLRLEVTPTNDAGTPTSLGKLTVTCYQKPSQKNYLAGFKIGDGGGQPQPAPVDYAAAQPPVEYGKPTYPPNPNNFNLVYTCELPVIGTPDEKGALTAKAVVDYPAKVGVNNYAPRIRIVTDDTISDKVVDGLLSVEAAKLTGVSATMKAKVVAPQFATPVDASIGLPVNDLDVPQDFPTLPINLKATGEAPALVFTKAGQASMTVEDLYLSATARKADGSIITAATFKDAKCVKDPADQNSAIKFEITGGTTPVDSTDPSVPGNVKGAGSVGGASLTWDASTDEEGGSGVKGYFVHRNGEKLPELVTDTKAAFSGLAAGTYKFAVSAVDNAGNESDASAPVDVVVEGEPTEDKTAPSVPGNVAGTGAVGSASVTWGASTDEEGGSGVKGYFVHRNGEKLPELVTDTKAAFSGLAAGTYKFAVSAVDNAGNESAASAPVDVVVEGEPTGDETAPSVPKNVKGAGSVGGASLTWDASTDEEGGSGVKGYFVHRNGEKLPELVTDTKAAFSGLAAGTYKFAVSAVDNAGNESAASTPIDVKVEGAPTEDKTAPSVPGAAKAEVANDSVALTWGASKDEEGGSGLAGYYLHQNGQKLPTLITEPKKALSGLAPGKYTFAVSAADKAGNESAPGGSVEVEIKGAPGGGSSYTLTGTSVIKKANGKTALTGGVNATVGADGKVSADLTLNPTTGNFSIFGFLPATASIAFAPEGKTTGTLAGGVLSTETKTVVKLPSVKVFGIEVGGGATCQTASAAVIPLKSTDFSVAGGGTLKGTYTLPALKGCGALTPIISALAAGPGNTVDLKATPKK